MKTNIFITLLLVFSTLVEAKNQTLQAKDSVKNDQEVEQLIEQYLKPEAMFNAFYDEFKFSSTQGALYNKYSGHTNYVGLGGDNLKAHNVYWGFNAYTIDTNTTALSLMPSLLSESETTIKNNGLYLHFMKEVFRPIFIDVFASYGRDRFKLTSMINGNTPLPSTGYSKYNGYDESIGVRTFLGQVYQAFVLQGHITYFYSQFYQPDYFISYPGFTIPVPSLTTKIGTLIEHARLYYQVNQSFAPFISGGLIQVTSRTYSRPLIDPNVATVSALPALFLGKNGYSYGLGLNYHYKKIQITPTYSHNVRGNTYSDNYIGVTFDFIGIS